MPPEYINHRQISKKFDVFSLGRIIIEIMAGRLGYTKCGEMPRQQFIDLVIFYSHHESRVLILLHVMQRINCFSAFILDP